MKALKKIIPTSLVLFFLLSSCGSRPFFRHSPNQPPPNSDHDGDGYSYAEETAAGSDPDSNASVPSPLVDPLNLDHIKEQPHIPPAFLILVITLSLCFIPFFWTKSTAYRQRLWAKRTAVGDWFKKKLDKNGK